MAAHDSSITTGGAPRGAAGRAAPALAGRPGPRGLFVSPALALLLFLSVFPLLWALYLSFTNYSATRDAPAEWVGFGNYLDILTSGGVHERAMTTLIYVVGAVGLQMVLGFTIAYLISRRTAAAGS